MKKKVLFGLGAIAIAAVLTFNVSVAKSSNSSYVDLSMLSSTATAQAESGNGYVCGHHYYNGRCYCYDTGYICGGASKCGGGAVYCD